MWFVSFFLKSPSAESQLTDLKYALAPKRWGPGAITSPKKVKKQERIIPVEADLFDCDVMDSLTCSIHIDGQKVEDKPIDYVSMETLGHIRSFAGAKHDADGWQDEWLCRSLNVVPKKKKKVVGIRRLGEISEQSAALRKGDRNRGSLNVRQGHKKRRRD